MHLALFIALLLPVTALAADADKDGYDEREDCDDTNPDVNPGADEVPGNDLDDDCDGLYDCYADEDYDGYGQDGVVWTWEVSAGAPNYCDDKHGAVTGGDCDDDDPDINPEATEIWYDGVDQDCDGNDDDQDLDGVGVGEDCDDEDHTVAVCEQRVGGGRSCSTSAAAGSWSLWLLLLLRRRR